MFNNGLKEQPCASQPDKVCVCWNSGVCKRGLMKEVIKEDIKSFISLLPSKYLKIKRQK